MSIQKTNHSVWHPFVAQTIAKNTAATTSEWFDTNGWTDKVVTINPTIGAGGSAVDCNIDILVSPKGAYELNNETTVDTEDYQVVQIVDNHTAAIVARFDSSDVDDLQRPIRSMAVVVDNDEASDGLVIDVWVEGWS